VQHIAHSSQNIRGEKILKATARQKETSAELIAWFFRWKQCRAYQRSPEKEHVVSLRSPSVPKNFEIAKQWFGIARAGLLAPVSGDKVVNQPRLKSNLL